MTEKINRLKLFTLRQMTITWSTQNDCCLIQIEYTQLIRCIATPSYDGSPPIRVHRLHTWWPIRCQLVDFNTWLKHGLSIGRDAELKYPVILWTAQVFQVSPGIKQNNWNKNFQLYLHSKWILTINQLIVETNTVKCKSIFLHQIKYLQECNRNEHKKADVTKTTV